MKKASIRALTLILLASVALSICATVKADTAVSVTVNDPYSQTLGNFGLPSGGYWVGEIPLTITSGSTASNTMGYCINFNRPINIGTSYPATLAPAGDSAEWRAVSYVLTWNKPTTNNEAAAAQVAVWRLLNQTRGADYFRESWLEAGIDSAGNAVANQAWGKDVVRQGDLFTWISPIAANMSSIQANPGQTLTFTAQLTSSTGAPRANVRVLFNATRSTAGQSLPLNSTYVTPAAAYTDSQGRVQVSVKVPGDSQLGATINVEGATQSVWPQRYINVNDPSVQDLIGVGGTFQLTISTNMCIFGFIQVLPESPIGPIAAIGAFGAGFAAWVKIKRKKPAKA